MIGRRYGKLTVAGFGGFDKDGNILYMAPCSCGEFHLLTKSELEKWSDEMCVCYKKPRKKRSEAKKKI